MNGINNNTGSNVFLNGDARGARKKKKSRKFKWNEYLCMKVALITGTHDLNVNSWSFPPHGRHCSMLFAVQFIAAFESWRCCLLVYTIYRTYYMVQLKKFRVHFNTTTAESNLVSFGRFLFSRPRHST